MTMIAENTSSQGLMTMEEVMQIIKTGLELGQTWILTKIESLLRNANQGSTQSNMKLVFRNKISQEILTREEIKGEGNTHIEVILVDGATGNVVDVGPEACASIGIVLLKGEADASEEDDWTVEEFNKNVIPEVEGKKPLLEGNVPVKLQRGIGVVKNIKFRNHASKIKPSVFKLGARVIGASNGSRIKEAQTESFTLKDFRNKFFFFFCFFKSSDYKKQETPSLSHEVFRLVNIRKGGKIDKRLQVNQINTVEKFLIQLLIDPEGLKTIVNLGKKKWEATVANAQACVSDSRMYCYINLEQKMGVVFNVLGQVLGLYIESQYYVTSILSENHKTYAQELLASAYKNWENVKPFDDMSSLQQYFTDSITHMGARDSGKANQPAVCHEKTVTSEMVGESSSPCSNNLHHRVCPTMNLTRETGSGGDDFDWLSNDNGGIVHSFGEASGDDRGWFDTNRGGIMYDHTQFSPGWPFGMSEDYESVQQNNSCNTQLDGLMSDLNADENGAATAVTFDESQVIYTSTRPKRNEFDGLGPNLG